MPENFDINLPKNSIKNEFLKYYKETEEDELHMLIGDMEESANNDSQYLSKVFTFLFNIIHEENLKILMDDMSNPFEKLEKNINLLLGLFTSFPNLIEAYINDDNFLPQKNIQNGSQFQLATYLSVYLYVNITDLPLENLHAIFPVYKTPLEVENTVKYRIKKNLNYFDHLLNLIYIIYEYNENSRQALKNWIYSLLNFNHDKKKIYQNNQVLSKNGFLFNTLYFILLIFFDGEYYNEFKPNGEYLFFLVKNINVNFTLSDNRIDFKKYERINTDSAKEIIDTVGNDENNFVEYSIYTELYFIANSLFEYLIKNIENQISQITNEFSEMQENNQNYKSDPKLYFYIFYIF